jgi:hypothetical protein
MYIIYQLKQIHTMDKEKDNKDISDTTDMIGTTDVKVEVIPNKSQTIKEKLQERMGVASVIEVQSLVKCLAELLENSLDGKDTSGDITLILKDDEGLEKGTKTFKAHSGLLRRSEMFKTMLDVKMHEKKEKVIDLTEYDPIYVEHMLAYLYYCGKEFVKDTEKIDVEHWFKLLLYASIFGIEVYKNKIISTITKKINFDNVIAIFKACQKHDHVNEELEKKCLKIICQSHCLGLKTNCCEHRGWSYSTSSIDAETCTCFINVKLRDHLKEDDSYTKEEVVQTLLLDTKIPDNFSIKKCCYHNRARLEKFNKDIQELTPCMKEKILNYTLQQNIGVSMKPIKKINLARKKSSKDEPKKTTKKVVAKKTAVKKTAAKKEYHSEDDDE